MLCTDSTILLLAPISTAATNAIGDRCTEGQCVASSETIKTVSARSTNIFLQLYLLISAPVDLFYPRQNNSGTEYSHMRSAVLAHILDHLCRARVLHFQSQLFQCHGSLSAACSAQIQFHSLRLATILLRAQLPGQVSQQLDVLPSLVLTGFGYARDSASVSSSYGAGGVRTET